jgi:hypothetical protein
MGKWHYKRPYKSFQMPSTDHWYHKEEDAIFFYTRGKPKSYHYAVQHYRIGVCQVCVECDDVEWDAEKVLAIMAGYRKAKTMGISGWKIEMFIEPHKINTYTRSSAAGTTTHRQSFWIPAIHNIDNWIPLRVDGS